MDVGPITGNSPIEVMKGIYRDIPALSLKHRKKGLSERLFPSPAKEAGEFVEFDNPYHTESMLITLD